MARAPLPLRPVVLGNLTDHDLTDNTSATCPHTSFVVGMDFQLIYYGLGPSPDGPYIGGVSLYCAGWEQPLRIHFRRLPNWRNSFMLPAYGVKIPGGIRDLVAYHDHDNVHRLAYADTTVGRARGMRWEQSKSEVAGCPLKGVLLHYREWVEGAKLFFDCSVYPTESATPPLFASTTFAASTTFPKTLAPNDASVAGIDFNQALPMGLYLLLAVLIVLLASLLIFLVRSSWPAAKVSNVVARAATARARGGYRPAQYVLVPMDHLGAGNRHVPLDGGSGATMQSESQGRRLAAQDEEGEELCLPTSGRLHA